MNGPTPREVKYDRQLRLWAANGQAELEKAHVCLINATAAGCETLKNLVLPGVGHFTILDDRCVSGGDAGSNFFLDGSSVGKPRSHKAVELLSELNPDVQGEAIQESPASYISDEGFWKKFTIVIACELQTEMLLELSRTLWDLCIPLVAIRCVGFVGGFRIAIPEHLIVESHPESLVDLRLDSPWQELSHLASFLNLEDMDNMEHSHVPYVLLLLKYLTDWKDIHGHSPSSFNEKSDFKKFIRQGMRNSDEGNYEEAIGAVWRACSVTTIPNEVQEVFSDPCCTHISQSSESFWILARAVRDFAANEGEGNLPLAGVLPDMKADSGRYVLLQNLYRKKARSDVDKVISRCHELLESISRPPDSISTDEIASFCKHARFLKVLRYRSLAEEYENPAIKELSDGLQSQDDLICFYLAFRAYDEFVARFGHAPGRASADDVSKDLRDMREFAMDIGRTFNSDVLSQSTENAIRELVRSGGGELHNIASLTGGMVAQEIIKVIARQYVPVNNTCIFDGISSKSQTWIL